MTNSKDDILLQKTLDYLAAIPEIDVNRRDETFVLLKAGNEFCKIKNETVYLLDKVTGNYKEVEKDILQVKDDFLLAATSSYWKASGQI